MLSITGVLQIGTPAGRFLDMFAYAPSPQDHECFPQPRMSAAKSSTVAHLWVRLLTMSRQPGTASCAFGFGIAIAKAAASRATIHVGWIVAATRRTAPVLWARMSRGGEDGAI